jgi:hypothetical protein
VYEDEDSQSQSCTPIPDQYYLEVWLEGTPATADVVLARDGTGLIDESVSFEYNASRPNGPECDPLCHQAAYELDVP